MLICGVILFNFVSVAVYRAHFKINIKSFLVSYVVTTLFILTIFQSIFLKFLHLL